jgi:dCMP deaminase
MEYTMNKILPKVVPTRDEFYLGIAFMAASRSKDPRTQCGSVIVSAENEPLGYGYNGPPRSIRDEDVDWGRPGEGGPGKYFTMIHSEVNAIKHSLGSTKGATLYSTGIPCPACMLSIVNAEISRVVWFPSQPCDGSSMLADLELADKTEEIARLGGVRLEKYKGRLNWMKERIGELDKIGVFAEQKEV